MSSQKTKLIIGVVAIAVVAGAFALSQSYNAEKEQQMEQAASQNRETVAALEQRIAALQQAGSDQEAVIAQLQQSLSEVTGSTSWKATAPLRRIGKLFRKSDQTRKS